MFVILTYFFQLVSLKCPISLCLQTLFLRYSIRDLSVFTIQYSGDSQ